MKQAIFCLNLQLGTTYSDHSAASTVSLTLPFWPIFMLPLSSVVDGPGCDTDPELKQGRDGSDERHILVHAAE